MKEIALRAVARAIFEQTLADCNIERAFREKVKACPAPHASTCLLFGEHVIDFASIRRIRIVAAGKAASSMLNALLIRIPKDSACDISGILIAPDATTLPPGIEHFAGGHPFPNEASLAGARAVLNMLKTLPADTTAENTLCVFLVSGGASAMMELPLDPDITLEETIAFHRALVHSGASITEINCVRKHFSAVKGGRLALAAHPAKCLTILLSDVPRGNHDMIASGPTLPDSSTIEESRQVLEHYHLLEQFPASIQRFFTSDQMPETMKPGTLTPFLWTILSAEDLAEAARIRAESLGFATIIDNSCDDWNYREAAEYLLSRVRELRRTKQRICLISAGEVTVRPEDAVNHETAILSGNGGRNQHFALYAATLLDESDEPLVILSAGSDGIDGHSDAAGAVVSTETLHDDSGTLQVTAQKALNEFHSSTFLQTVDARIVTGPTGNNLRDLRLLIADTSGNK